MKSKQLSIGAACLLGVVAICLMVSMEMKREYDPFGVMGLAISSVIAYLVFQLTQRADSAKNHRILLTSDIQSLIEALNNLETEVCRSATYNKLQRGLALEDISIAISDLREVIECSAIDQSALCLDEIDALFMSYEGVVTADFERSAEDRLSSHFLQELTSSFRPLRSKLLRLRLDVYSSTMRDI